MVIRIRAVVCLAVIAVMAMSATAETVSSSPAGPADMNDAKRLITEGKRNEAIPILEKIVTSDQTLAPQALKMIGDCYKTLRNWNKVVEAFEKLLTEYPGSIAPDKEVKSWIMDYHLANGDIEKCLSLQKELISEYPSDAWKFYYIVGRRHVWKHDHSKAIPELEKAVELGIAFKNHPDVIEANKQLLHCYLVKKQWDKAEDLIGRLTKDYPDEMYEWDYATGRLYRGLGKYDKAIEYLEKAAESNKKLTNPRAMFKALLLCYSITGNLEQRIALSKKLIEAYPEDALTWKWELAITYRGDKQYDKAAPIFKSIIDSSYTRWQVRSSQIYYGECLYELGKGDEVFERIENYYKDKPELWDEYMLVKSAVLLYGAKDYNECIEVANQLMAKSAKEKKSALVSTAKELILGANQELGRWEEAAHILEEMATKKNDMFLMYQAGHNYFQAENYEEARRIYRIVLDQEKIEDEIRASAEYELAVCFWNLGLKNAAKRLAEKVRDKYPNTYPAMQAEGSLCKWSENQPAK